MNNFHLSNLLKNLVIVAFVSVIINLLLMYVGRMISFVPDTFGPYKIMSITVLTVLGVVAAAIVYAVMRWLIKNASKANRWFIIVSIIALIVSFYPDVMIPWSHDPDQVGWTYITIVNLMLMHVITAVLVMTLFTREKRKEISTVQHNAVV